MSKNIIIAVDAMGGDNSPHKVIEAIKIVNSKDKDIFFKIYGDSTKINNEIEKTSLNKKYFELIHTDISISDTESPLQAAKKNNKSSMWKSIESVKSKESHIALSAGNTGALLVLSKMILEMIKGIDKPALAGLWPNKFGMNIVLDLGASVDCNGKNLIDFSYMGAALYNSLFPNEISKVSLLNIGSEEIKGHEVIKEAYQILKLNKNENFEFKGYIEGNNIMDGNSNVIVTDGFTGNIALKTAEGTANFITKSLKKSLTKNFFTTIASIIIKKSLTEFKEKLDPRKYNGAIFLGLNGPVVKSHGSIDALGFAYSIKMCKKIVEGDLIKKISINLSK
tara:strand:+ start:1518 stop:2528 length:1011 start_codon:yes stop_codon:yes gene_type:complete